MLRKRQPREGLKTLRLSTLDNLANNRGKRAGVYAGGLMREWQTGVLVSEGGQVTGNGGNTLRALQGM